MYANIFQAQLIEHYAKRRGLPIEPAAREWVSKRAAKFRAWLNRRPEKGA
jgi:hypothetical protein